MTKAFEDLFKNMPAPGKEWIVMSAVTFGKSKKSLFSTNAVGLTEAEAKAEAERRNDLDKANMVEWFPSKDPRVEILKAMSR